MSVTRLTAARRASTSGTGALHAEAVGWASRVATNSGTVSQATLLAVSEFCSAIDAAGIRGSFFRLNLFCGTGLEAALVPLYRSEGVSVAARGNSTDTNNNFVSGDYTETGASRGLIGNGTTKFLATGFAPNTLPAASMHLSAYIVTANSTTGAAAALGQFAGAGSTELSLRHRESNVIGNSFYAVFNDANSFVRGPVGNQIGHLIGTNTALNDKRFYQNGAQLGATDTLTSTSTRSSDGIFVCAVNQGGTAFFHSNARLAAYSVGSGLTAAQALAYYRAMQTFQTAMNR